jgi:predicted transcriptional regulator
MLETIKERDTEGASRTMIMYNCYLSYAQLREYLSFLTEKGLVDESPQQSKNESSNKKFVYRMTGKGLRFLQICKEIENIVGSD